MAVFLHAIFIFDSESIATLVLNVSAVDCGLPEGASDAMTVLLTSTTYNSSVMFRCLPGYWFYRDVFTLTSTCQDDGQWTRPERTACFRKTSFYIRHDSRAHVCLEL